MDISNCRMPRVFKCRQCPSNLSRQSNCLHQMFNASSFLADIFMQSITPLIHCSVDNVLIKAMPLFNRSFFQMIDIANLATVDLLLQNPPNLIVHRIQNWARWSLQWTDEDGSLCGQQCNSLVWWAGALSCW